MSNQVYVAGGFGSQDASKKVKKPLVLQGFRLFFEIYVELKFKTLPRRFQEAPKTPPRRVKRRPRRLQDASKTPQDDPRGAQDASKTPLRRLKTTQDAPKTPQDLPKTPQDAAKTPPRRPKTCQDAPRRARDAPRCTRSRKMRPTWSQVGMKIQFKSILMLTISRIQKRFKNQ